MGTNIYLVRSGQSVSEGLDTDRFLTEQSKEVLYQLHHRLLKENTPQIVFHSNTKRSEQTAKILWPKVKRQPVSGLYTPIEQNSFVAVKNFLQDHNAEVIRSVWSRVHKKDDTQTAITNFYEQCCYATEEIIAQTVTTPCFAIVGHEVIINLVGHFLASDKINKNDLLNAHFKNGEIRLIQYEKVQILSQ